MSTPSLYLYRHVQTQQVLVSLRQNMKNKTLKQITEVKKPLTLRKDLWRPLVAVTGFPTPQSAQAVSDALIKRSKDRQIDLKTSEEHLLRPKRLRVVDELNMVEKSIVSLCEALETVGPKDDNKLLALWEQPHFMDLKGDKQWPSNIEHGELELRNNRFVKVDTE
ncbi:hypothetical protein BDB01DRAFT_849441 [Pilobolus umbonatus]|nr:hypothetical protein BDB01DRAFT_849441 [Pilobolus umbonatus]